MSVSPGAPPGVDYADDTNDFDKRPESISPRRSSRASRSPSPRYRSRSRSADSHRRGKSTSPLERNGLADPDDNVMGERNRSRSRSPSVVSPKRRSRSPNSPSQRKSRYVSDGSRRSRSYDSCDRRDSPKQRSPSPSPRRRSRSPSPRRRSSSRERRGRRERSRERYHRRSPTPERKRRRRSRSETPPPLDATYYSGGRDPDGRSRPEPSKTLGVFGLNYATTERDLEYAFEKYGHIVDVKLIRDPAGASRGFGFITFDSMHEAKDARSAMRQAKLDGRYVRVDYSVTRGPHARTPGYYQGLRNMDRSGRRRRSRSRSYSPRRRY